MHAQFENSHKNAFSISSKCMHFQKMCFLIFDFCLFCMNFEIENTFSAFFFCISAFFAYILNMQKKVIWGVSVILFIKGNFSNRAVLIL